MACLAPAPQKPQTKDMSRPEDLVLHLQPARPPVQHSLYHSHQQPQRRRSHEVLSSPSTEALILQRPLLLPSQAGGTCLKACTAQGLEAKRELWRTCGLLGLKGSIQLSIICTASLCLPLPAGLGLTVELCPVVHIHCAAIPAGSNTPRNVNKTDKAMSWSRNQTSLGR